MEDAGAEETQGVASSLVCEYLRAHGLGDVAAAVERELAPVGATADLRSRKLDKLRRAPGSKGAPSVLDMIAPPQIAHRRGMSYSDATSQDSESTSDMPQQGASRKGSSWSEDDQSLLRDMCRHYPSSMEKNARWKAISTAFGTKYSKKDCYAQYKALRASGDLVEAPAGPPAPQAPTTETSREPEQAVASEAPAAPAASEETQGEAAASAPTVPRADAPVSGWGALPMAAQGTAGAEELVIEERGESSDEEGGVVVEPGFAPRPNRPVSRRGGRGGRENDEGRAATAWGDEPEEAEAEKEVAAEADGPAPSEQAAEPQQVAWGGLPASGRRDAAGRPGASRATAAAGDSGGDLLLEDVAEAEEGTPSPAAAAQGRPGRVLPVRTGAGGGPSGEAAPAANAPLPKGGTPVDPRTCRRARDVIFGAEAEAATRVFPPSWRQQGLFFSQCDGLRWGIVQRKGGPCGVLAATQAFILHHLLFAEDAPYRESGDDGAWRSPSEAEQGDALAKAVATIAWQAGGWRQCFLASPRAGPATRGAGKPDGATERMQLHRMASWEQARAFVARHLGVYMAPSGMGALLVLYSALFSRGVEAVAADMDAGMGPATALMGPHNYAAQEMVNLLLCGRAHSNVFDGERRMEGGEGDETVLRGPPARCTVGLLTLFEHYGYVAVGSHMKDPGSPVWVVCSESHYTVLVHPARPSPAGSRHAFDLFYFDGLANQDEVIRLTVRPPAVDPGPRPAAASGQAPDMDLVPPLNHCIRTAWPGADVDWNDTEPLL